MKKQFSKFINNWIYLGTIGLLSFFLISLFIYYSGVYYSKKSIKQYSLFIEKKLKNNVKSEVLSRINEIDYDLEKIIEEENLITKEKINLLKNILLSSDLMKINNIEERRKEAILKIELFIKNDPNYLYFVMDPNGSVLRSGTNNNIKGTNLINTADKNGFFFVKELIKAFDKPEGLYVTYYWPKNKNGEPLKKTSYCLYLPEFNFIIGTGSYEEDIYKNLKKRTFERIQNYYKGKENYIFVVDYSGMVKVHSNPDFIEKNFNNIEDDNIEGLHSIIMNKLKDGNGFISYSFRENKDSILYEKISYIHAIDKWKVYIGMGFHKEDISKEILNINNISKKHHFEETIIVIIILILISFVSYVYIQKGLNIQKDILEQDDIVFERLFNLTNEGIVIVSKFGEILYKNEVIDLIFKEDLKIFFTSNIEDCFNYIEKNVYLFKNSNDREYFIDIIIEKIFYMGKDCKIFIIKNISKQYIKENKLQKMAYYDQLTELPNRRKLNNDFEDLLTHKPNKNYELVLAILDLDRFKNVNDKYGHNVGDQVLVNFGKVIKNNLRKTEEIYRFGGEEFIILFKQMEIVKVKKILTEINEKMAKNMLEKFGFEVTFSSGVIYINNDFEDLEIENYIKKADKLLYRAKDKGRRRVEIELDTEEEL